LSVAVVRSTGTRVWEESLDRAESIRHAVRISSGRYGGGNKQANKGSPRVDGQTIAESRRI